MSPAGSLTAGGLVMADTCIWIAAEKSSSVAGVLIDLAGRDRLVMCGVVYAEILRGIQEPALRERRASQLAVLQWGDAPPKLWLQTAETAREQDRAGRAIPLTDAHVAAMCIANNVALWTTDRHFDRVQGLCRFRPDRV